MDWARIVERMEKRAAWIVTVMIWGDIVDCGVWCSVLGIEVDGKELCAVQLVCWYGV